MSDLYSDAAQQVQALIAQFQAQTQGKKLGVVGLISIVHQAVEGFIAIYSDLNVPGTTNQALITTAFSQFYTEVLSPIVLKYVPSFLQSSVNLIVQPAFMALVNKLYITITTVLGNLS